MSYKKSRFNFIYKRNENEFVIYNTYSKAVVVLDDVEYEQYNSLKFKDKIIENELVKNFVLLDSEFDELGFLSYCHYQTKFSQGALHLVLATTMDCNFGCPYCYENRRRGKMSEEVQNSIFEFIKVHIDKGVKEIDVTWYGGEPLLYPDIVEKMAEEIRRIADVNACIDVQNVVNWFRQNFHQVEWDNILFKG